MANFPHPLRQGQEMTGRAQAYLSVCGGRNLVLGALLILRQDDFKSDSYIYIERLIWGFGFPVSGWLFTLTGIICLTGAIYRSESLARLGLYMCVFGGAVWVGCFYAAWDSGFLTGPTGPIIWTAVVLKDLIQCRMPVRASFEPVVDDLLLFRRDRAEGSGG